MCFLSSITFLRKIYSIFEWRACHGLIITPIGFKQDLRSIWVDSGSAKPFRDCKNKILVERKHFRSQMKQTLVTNFFINLNFSLQKRISKKMHHVNHGKESSKFSQMVFTKANQQSMNAKKKRLLQNSLNCWQLLILVSKIYNQKLEG